MKLHTNNFSGTLIIWILRPSIKRVKFLGDDRFSDRRNENSEFGIDSYFVKTKGFLKCLTTNTLLKSFCDIKFFAFIMEKLNPKIYI